MGFERDRDEEGVRAFREMDASKLAWQEDKGVSVGVIAMSSEPGRGAGGGAALPATGAPFMCLHHLHTLDLTLLFDLNVPFDSWCLN